MTKKNVFWKFLGLLEKRLMIYIVSIIMMTTFYSVFEVTGSLFVKFMFDIAEKLAKDFPCVRVDLYCANKIIYFGEMTFFPQAGFDSNLLEQTDLLWGEKIILKKFK